MIRRKSPDDKSDVALFRIVNSLIPEWYIFTVGLQELAL
jgi:hypothetical protein